METSNQKIPDIFANNYFRIPDYQRGYAWKADKQLPDLWDDIEDIPTNPSGGYKPHYTGAISLQKRYLKILIPSAKGKAYIPTT